MAWNIILSVVGAVLLIYRNGLTGSPLMLLGVFLFGIVALSTGIILMFVQTVKTDNPKEDY